MARHTPPHQIGWKVISKAKANRAGALLLALVLAGCGGGDESSSSGHDSPLPPTPAEQVQVVDGFGVAKPNERTLLDLSAFVRGRNATLTSLTSEQPECGTGNVSGLTAEVNISDTTLCQYRFSARNSGSDEGVATLNVLATLADSPVLEPLSATMTLSDTAKAFDVVALYGASLPAGYNLKANSVMVQGGTVQGTATQSGNVITYTQPSAADWNRVLFTLEDPTKPGEDILGTLYITVSETANQAPTISNVKYNYSDAANAGASNPSIVTFQGVTLDLANLKNLSITDPEGKAWQLIEVQSYSASVASATPDDVTNKKFTFTAGTVGQHIVSYIVGDHEGGYRMGLMSIMVGPKEQAKDWANIDLATSGLRFYAPPLFSELKNAVGPQLGAFVEPTWDVAVNGGTGNTIGTAGNLAATAYCSGKRLPQKADLDALRSATGMLATELAKYPKSRSYLISDAAGTTFQTYNLANGNVTSYVAGVTPNPYVVCVSDHRISYIATPNTPYAGMTNTVISDGTWQTIGTVNSDGGTTSTSPTLFGPPVNAGPSGLTAENFRLTPGSCVGGVCTLDARGASDEYGVATAQIANAVMTSNTVNVPTTFLQNAQVTAATVTTNDQSADDNASTPNVITLTLKNKDGSAVPDGTEVKLGYDFDTSPAFVPTITPANNGTAIVNASSQITVNIRSNTAGTVTLVNPVVVGGLPLVETLTTVKFVPPDPTTTAVVTDLVVTTDDSLADGSSENLLMATVKGPYGELVSGVTVNWSVITGSATLTADSSVTNADGQAFIGVKSSTAGTVKIGAIVSTNSMDDGKTVDTKFSTLLSRFTLYPGNVSKATALRICSDAKLRLPSVSELQKLFFTEASVTGPLPVEERTIVMCNKHGWPLIGACGGSKDYYWTNQGYITVNMSRGTTPTVASSDTNPVACIAN